MEKNPIQSDPLLIFPEWRPDLKRSIFLQHESALELLNLANYQLTVSQRLFEYAKSCNIFCGQNAGTKCRDCF